MAILVVLTLLTKNLIIVFFILAYLLWRNNFSNIILYVLIVSLLFVSLQLKNFGSDYYYVKTINQNKIVATNLICDVQLKNIDNLREGDIFKIPKKSLNQIDFPNLNTKNIYYLANDLNAESEFKIITLNSFLASSIRKIEDVKIQAFLKKMVLRTTEYDLLEQDMLSLSFSFYLILIWLEKALDQIKINSKSKIILLFIICFELFPLDITITRLLLFRISRRIFKNYDYVWSLPVILMLIYNPLFIKNIGFQVSFLIHLLLTFKLKLDFRLVILIIEAFFFNQVQLIKWLFYRAYLSIYSLFYLLSVICLLFHVRDFNWLYQFTILVQKINCIEINGHLSLVIIIFYLLFIKYSELAKLLQKPILILLIISNVSNIFGTVTFIDVGQGDAILLKAPFNSQSILIDTGPKVSYYLLKRCLDRFGTYKIDYLVVTHSDEDHIGNLKHLARDYLIGEIVYTHHDIDSKMGLFKSLNQSVYDNPNDNSIVYYLDYYQRMKFMLTGDISQKVEQIIINENPFIEADVLKLSHHGSKSGSNLKFLYGLNPVYGIASTNGKYGHPHNEVIEKLALMDIEMLSTHQLGDISFVFTNLFKFIVCSNGEFVIIK